jgi:hypothetical protein
MKPAEFEEREYETPLYNQLERSPSPVWSPGQVLEARTGIDHSVFMAEQAVWEVLGYVGVPPGVVLSRIHWPPWWGPPSPRRALPNFRLNLFIQAKRSHFGPRPPRIALDAGFRGTTWAFHVTNHQQDLLDVLTEKCGRKAVVVYAAPVFHAVKDLYRHTTNSSIVDNSTFPTASLLSGHKTWYYQAPGAVGIANPEARRIEELPLDDRLLAALLEASQNGGISGVWKAIVETVSDSRLQDHPRVARFSDARLVRSRLLEQIGVDQPILEYSEVVLFTAMLGLIWLVVGKKPYVAA